MKRLQEETLTKMAVLGRGSMRDKQKEEDLRLSQVFIHFFVSRIKDIQSSSESI